jgi:hypothetical protein
MAHYAFLDSNYIVTEVIVGKDENNFDWERHYGDIKGQLCKRTSYNTIAGVHIHGGEPYRKNFAGIGHIYDPDRDAFYSPQPFDSWTLNEETCVWEAPTTYPTDNKMYLWNEATQEWDKVVINGETS